MKFRYDSFCGLYCGACDTLHATKRGENGELAKQWRRNLEDVTCRGCKTGEVSIFCRNCDIKSCAETRGVDFCYMCPEFPCQRIIQFKEDQHPHHSIVLENLQTIKRDGLASWLEQEVRRWRCVCGRESTWYEEECKDCGSSLKSCQQQEREL